MNFVSDGLYRGCRVNCGRMNQFLLREDILSAIYDRLIFMTNIHERVAVLRYDLRFPKSFEYENGDSSLKTFMNNYTIFLNRRGYEYQYVWVKENSSGENVHYHCVFFVNAKSCGRLGYFHQQAQSIWSSVCSDDFCVAPKNLLHIAEKKFDERLYSSHVILDRDDIVFEETFSDCLNWVSYLAKVNTKIVNPKRGNRGWGSSRCVNNV